jgi:hypothetical protein
MKHTPGPWTYQRGTVDYHIWPIGWHKSGSYSKEIDFTEEDHANARLISAAPELLDLLLQIVGQENPNQWGYDSASVALDDEWRAAARAVIAKIKKEKQ